MASEDATCLHRSTHLSTMNFLQTSNTQFSAQGMQFMNLGIPQNLVDTEKPPRIPRDNSEVLAQAGKRRIRTRGGVRNTTPHKMCQ